PQDSRLGGELSEYVGAYLDDRSGRALAGVRKAATALGVSTTDIALAFNRRRGIACSLVSARTPAQLAEVTVSDVDSAEESAVVLYQISCVGGGPQPEETARSVVLVVIEDELVVIVLRILDIVEEFEGGHLVESCVDGIFIDFEGIGQS